MYEGDLPAAMLTRSGQVWSESTELEREIHLLLSEVVDVPPAQ
ncbi:hypothetical protein ABTZ58_35960 [Streptomyces sp. NPDC094143]